MAFSDDDRPVELNDDDYAVLPDQTSDDTDQGWGEAPPRRPSRDRLSTHDIDLLENRPPHWGG